MKETLEKCANSDLETKGTYSDDQIGLNLVQQTTEAMCRKTSEIRDKIRPKTIEATLRMTLKPTKKGDKMCQQTTGTICQKSLETTDTIFEKIHRVCERYSCNLSSKKGSNSHSTGQKIKRLQLKQSVVIYKQVILLLFNTLLYFLAFNIFEFSIDESNTDVNNTWKYLYRNWMVLHEQSTNSCRLGCFCST